MPEAQVAIVGAGIIGLAHAYEAARRGLRVVVFERHPFAQGASVRNFGMIWPIGQPPGSRLQLALRSREIWEGLLADAGVRSAEKGSIHLAYREDERAVIGDFAEIGPQHGYQCCWITAQQAVARCN